MNASASRFRWCVPALLMLIPLAVGCASSSNPVTEAGLASPRAPMVTTHPNRTLISYGGQFMTSCRFSHDLDDDPIVHRGYPGTSHQHEFFGNTSTDAFSTYASMIHKATTCSDPGDHSAYWVPALIIDGKRIEPRRIDAYYRVGPGVAPGSVRPFPDGLEILAGDQHATRPSPLDIAAWTCGLSPDVASSPPRDCTPDRPIQLRLTYPSCWDGKHIRSDDHTSHMAYPSDRHGCDAAHPVAVPQLTLTVHYPFAGTYRQAKLASGAFATTHGDFLAAWQHKRLDDQVTGCLHREVTCGIVGGTFHTGQGSRDINTYNLMPGAPPKTGEVTYDHGVTTTTMGAGDMTEMGH